MVASPNAQFAIVRRRQVEADTGLPRSTLYARIKAGLFVRPVACGKRSRGWPLNEVAQLNAALIAGKTADEIRALVARLEAARKTLVPGVHNDSNP